MFVREGANWSVIERDSERRPNEQLFDVLHHPYEVNEFINETTSEDGERKMMSMQEIKQQLVVLAGHRHSC